MNKAVTKRTDDGADLVFGDGVSIELVRVVSKVVLERFPTKAAALAVAAPDELLRASLDGRPVFGDARANLVDVVVDVHVERIVRPAEPSGQWKLTDGDTLARGKVHLLVVQHNPSGRFQRYVDLLARLLLRVLHWSTVRKSQS